MSEQAESGAGLAGPRGRRSGSAGAFAWSGLESASRQIVTLVLSLVVVAFVTPHDLGVYSLSFSFVLVMALVVDVPIGDALIQGAHTSRDDWNTGFSVNMMIATAGVVLSWLLGRALGYAFREPDLATAFPVLASSLVIGAFGNTQKSFLTREMQFGPLTRIALVANTTGSLFSFALALMGNGYWALISNLLVTNVVSSALYWRASPWKPQPLLHRDSLARIWRFAGQSFLAQCVLQLREGTLPIAVGWFAGATALGWFALALRLSRTLGLFFEDLTRRPLFTLVSRMHHAEEPVEPLLLNVVSLVGALALPGFAGLAVIGPVLMPLAFGARWADSGRTLPLLCVVVLGWLTIHVPAIALRAQGRTGLAVLSLLAPTLIDLVIIGAAMPFGVDLALAIMALRAVAWLFPLGIILQRVVGVRAGSIARSLRLSVLGAAVMAAALVFLRSHAGGGWASLLMLTVAGAVIYGGVVGLGMALGDRSLLRAARSFRTAS